MEPCSRRSLAPGPTSTSFIPKGTAVYSNFRLLLTQVFFFFYHQSDAKCGLHYTIFIPDNHIFKSCNIKHLTVSRTFISVL